MTRRVDDSQISRLSPSQIFHSSRFALLAASLVALAACGGGGGGGGGGSSNHAPSASFVASPSTGSAPLTVAFDASASSDSDTGDSIATFAWTFGDGGSGSGANVSHVYSTAGSFTATLTVTDTHGATGRATRTISVNPNQAPTASMQFAPGCGTAPLAVAFDGSRSSDADGTVASYAWDFGDGSSATGATPTHTYTNPGSYTVVLTVTDDGGSTSQWTDSITILSGPGNGPVPVSGRVTFERVPFSTNVDQGLDYAATFAAPAKQVVVELLMSSSQSVLASTLTDANGQYSFNAPQDTSVVVRARAETCNTSPSWLIRARDNVNGNALYVLDTSAFNTGTTSVTRNLLADSGWPDFGGTSYSGPRSAAPFAILDTLYSAVQFVLANGGATVDFAPLQVFWDPQNKPSNNFDPATGAIISSSYRATGSSSAPPGMYVQGLQSNDTDEYDESVLAHEFQHYLEDWLSRSDTPGGSHGTGERIDMRLAFSEGFANAFSSMVLGTPVYSDSLGTSQSQRFTFNVENENNAPAGWFNEGSVESIIWDLYDTVSDGVDTVSIGYAPMFSVFRNELRTGQALTSIYPFATGLKTIVSSTEANKIDVLMHRESIFGTDAFGSDETTDGNVPQSLPIYTDLTVGGGTKTVCTTAAIGFYNHIGNRQFLKFSLASGRAVTIRVEYTSAGSTSPFTPTPDPDFQLYEGGFLTSSESDAANVETLTRTLGAGDYVLEVYDYSHVDRSSNAQRRGITCMNVSVN